MSNTTTAQAAQRNNELRDAISKHEAKRKGEAEGERQTLLTAQEKAHVEHWFFEALASHQTECPELAAEQAQERAEDTLDWPEGEDNQEAWMDAIAEWCAEMAAEQAAE